MKRKRGKEMLEYEIEIGKEELDALLEIATILTPYLYSL